MWTGIRIVRPLSAIARVTAWRNPPRGVGGELVAAAVVELLDRADEAQRALLDQIQERQAAAQVALRNRHDEAQVGLDHLLLGDQVTALDAACQLDLAVGREQLHLADGTKVETKRVQARLHRQIDLGLACVRRVLRRACLGLGVRHRLAIGRDDLDALVQQVRVQLRDLLLGDLDLFQRGGDLLDGQDPPFLAFGDERAKLVDLGDRRFIRQECFGLGAHPHPSGRNSGVAPPPGPPLSVPIRLPRHLSRRAEFFWFIPLPLRELVCTVPAL